MRSAPVFAFSLVSLATPLAAQNDLHLIPQPREMRVEGAAMSVAKGIMVSRPSNPEDRFAASDLATVLKDRGIRSLSGETGPGTYVVLMRANAADARSLLRRHSLAFDSSMHEEGSVVIPDDSRIVVIGPTAAKVFYGAQTVKQVLTGDGDHA